MTQNQHKELAVLLAEMRAFPFIQEPKDGVILLSSSDARYLTETHNSLIGLDLRCIRCVLHQQNDHKPHAKLRHFRRTCPPFQTHLLLLSKPLG